MSIEEKRGAGAHGAGAGGTGTGGTGVRNVVLVGHTGAGKTTLAEAVLAATGAVARAGRVEDGSTVTDHEEVEHRLGRSTSLAAATCSWQGVRITLLDTPGHPDFVGELRAGLRAADAALFVVSAVDGVDGGTRLLWEECAAVGMPRAVVVTHVDAPRGDLDTVVTICQRLFGDGVQPLYVPLHEDDGSAAGLLGLLSETVFQPGAEPRAAEPEHLEAVADARDALVEGIIAESEDETLLERYLAGEPVGYGTLVDDLETAVARGSFYPLLPVVPTTGLGVPELLEVLTRAFPCPSERTLPPVTGPEGEPREAVRSDAGGPLVAEVVRTASDPYVGRVSLVRVFSGTLVPDAPVHVSGHFSRFSHPGPEHELRVDSDEAWHPGHDVDERVGAISVPLGATLTQVPRAVAGDIVSVARLTRAETGDTLSDPGTPTLMEPWTLPDPLLPVAISARSTSEEDRLGHGLARLQAEDPTVRVVVDPHTHQMVLWCMGEAHLDVLRARLLGRSGVEVVTEPVRVAMRETFAAPGAGHGRHVKQSGGHGQFAVCDVEVEPLATGAGFEFVDKVVGGAVPRQYIASVEKGVRAQMERGVAAGYPVVDVRVLLVGGKAHSVDSSDAAFQTAGALALKDAAATAGVQMLEPVDVVDVVVDDEYVGAVMSDLSTRRGRVTGTEPLGTGRSRVTAEVPAFELTRYAVDLRSVAHGTGAFTRAYARHAPAPRTVLDRLASVV